MLHEPEIRHRLTATRPRPWTAAEVASAVGVAERDARTALWALAGRGEVVCLSPRWRTWRGLPPLERTALVDSVYAAD